MKTCAKLNSLLDNHILDKMTDTESNNDNTVGELEKWVAEFITITAGVVARRDTKLKIPNMCGGRDKRVDVYICETDFCNDYTGVSEIKAPFRSINKNAGNQMSAMLGSLCTLEDADGRPLLMVNFMPKHNPLFEKKVLTKWEETIIKDAQPIFKYLKLDSQYVVVEVWYETNKDADNIEITEYPDITKLEETIIKLFKED